MFCSIHGRSIIFAVSAYLTRLLKWIYYWVCDERLKILSANCTTIVTFTKEKKQRRKQIWMTCTRPKAISSFYMLCAVFLFCYYDDHILFYKKRVCCVFVFGYIIFFLATLNAFRAVGKFNQEPLQTLLACNILFLSTHIIWYIILMKLMLFKDLFIIFFKDFLFIFATQRLNIAHLV